MRSELKRSINNIRKVKRKKEKLDNLVFQANDESNYPEVFFKTGSFKNAADFSSLSFLIIMQPHRLKCLVKVRSLTCVFLSVLQNF